MTVFSPAARLRRIKPSPSTSAADRANELRRQGKSIVNLVVGEPDFDTPLHIREAATEAMNKALKKGSNTLAVHSKESGDGQFIDLGFLVLVLGLYLLLAIL